MDLGIFWNVYSQGGLFFALFLIAFKYRKQIYEKLTSDGFKKFLVRNDIYLNRNRIKNDPELRTHIAQILEITPTVKQNIGAQLKVVRTANVVAEKLFNQILETTQVQRCIIYRVHNGEYSSDGLSLYKLSAIAECCKGSQLLSDLQSIEIERLPYPFDSLYAETFLSVPRRNFTKDSTLSKWYLHKQVNHICTQILLAPNGNVLAVIELHFDYLDALHVEVIKQTMQAISNDLGKGFN